MLRRYPDAIRTFVSILNWIMRMRQYHTRSYQYDQVCSVAFGYRIFSHCFAVDQQNGRQDVRPLCHMQCSFPEQTGRQHCQHIEGTIWRTICKNGPRPVSLNSVFIRSGRDQRRFLPGRTLSRRSRSFSCMRAQNSSTPTPRRMMTLQPSPPLWLRHHQTHPPPSSGNRSPIPPNGI
jgi:hypothetical protein